MEVDPKGDIPPRYVLRQPYVVGTQWEASTVAYILQRRNSVQAGQLTAVVWRAGLLTRAARKALVLLNA